MFSASIRYLLSLRNSARRRIIIAIDSVFLTLAAYLAIAIVSTGILAPGIRELLVVATAVILTVVTLILTKSYRAIIRHLDVQTIARVIVSVVLASLIWIAVVNYVGFARPHQLTLLLLQSILSIFFLIGYRIGIYILISKRVEPRKNVSNIAIFGLGAGSRQFAASLNRSKIFRPAFFFADDSSLDGGLVDGLRVYSYEHLDWALERFKPSAFVFPEGSGNSATHSELVQKLLSNSVEVKLFDSVDHSLGKNLVMEIARPLEIEDLLGRQKNPVEEDLLKMAVAGHRILITGAGGSIGSAIARRVALLDPDMIGLMDMDESGLVGVADEIRASGKNPEIYLGNITDRAFVDSVVGAAVYDTIIHAAAYKHVSMGEICPDAVIINNIIGTFNLMEAAVKNGVGRFLQVSTDKSVEPTCVMGATKLWCERLVSAYAEPGAGRKFASVRFGNVIESRGSVIPLFKKQIARGGPVTVTHPQMRRYFMSIEEAVDLVIQSMAMADGGETFILDMGEPHYILDIAKSAIQLAGKTPRLPGESHGDVEIVFTTAHEVEKLEEKLFADFENPSPSRHPSISVSIAAKMSIAEISGMKDTLVTAKQSSPDDIRKILFDQVESLNVSG